MPLSLALRAYLKIFHRLRVAGQDHVPSEGGFAIVANHSSHLDALLLSSALPFNRHGHIFPLAAGDVFFQKGFIGWLSSLFLNALPVWRNRAAAQSLQEYRDRLVAGHDVFILFPEGTRSRDASFGRFKPGVGRLVAGTQSKVVPCWIEGAHEALPPGSRFPRQGRPISIRFGPPLQFEAEEDKREGWIAVSDQLEAAVTGLRNERSTT